MLGIRHVKTEVEAGKIASQYARAMARTSLDKKQSLAFSPSLTSPRRR